MRKRLKYSIILIFIQTLSLTLHAGDIAPDSLMDARNELRNTYDSIRMQSAADTGIVNVNEFMNAANELINFDNTLIEVQFEKIKRTSDSISAVNKELFTAFQDQSQRANTRFYQLLLISAVCLGLLVLFLIAFIAWLRRRNKMNKLLLQHIENDRLLAEYRKRLNELQSDLDNCMTQAKTIVNEKSQLEKEINRLTDENQKARDAGWLTDSGTISYPDQIKALENQLFAETTRKKILEQELLEILRKLRGEE
ncbi:MAG: hypothetical protein AB9842_06225 [Bacteroidales bacterium]